MKNFFLIVLLSGFSCLLHAQDATGNSTKKEVGKTQNFELQRDVVYTTIGNWNGKMDIYSPKSMAKKFSVIIFIHGGAWQGGSKESVSNVFRYLLDSGYAVVNVEYRLTGQATAPAAIEDIRCALAYLVKNANDLKLDTSKFVMMGFSAGAHLALLAGLLNRNNEFSKRCPESNEIKIAAIIDNSGITDVASLLDGPTKRGWAVKWIGNNINNEAFVKSVSPISYVNQNSPPVFIVQANGDPTVPYEQSKKLSESLKRFNVKTQFITVPENVHVYFSEPQRLMVNNEIVKFLRGLGI